MLSREKTRLIINMCWLESYALTSPSSIISTSTSSSLEISPLDSHRLCSVMYPAFPKYCVCHFIWKVAGKTFGMSHGLSPPNFILSNYISVYISPTKFQRRQRDKYQGQVESLFHGITQVYCREHRNENHD